MKKESCIRYCILREGKKKTANDNTKGGRKKKTPNVGLEPTTLRLRVSCSTD